MWYTWDVDSGESSHTVLSTSVLVESRVILVSSSSSISTGAGMYPWPRYFALSICSFNAPPIRRSNRDSSPAAVTVLRTDELVSDSMLSEWWWYCPQLSCLVQSNGRNFSSRYCRARAASDKVPASDKVDLDARFLGLSGSPSSNSSSSSWTASKLDSFF